MFDTGKMIALWTLKNDLWLLTLLKKDIIELFKIEPNEAMDFQDTIEQELSVNAIDTDDMDSYKWWD